MNYENIKQKLGAGYLAHLTKDTLDFYLSYCGEGEVSKIVKNTANNSLQWNDLGLPINIKDLRNFVCENMLNLSFAWDEYRMEAKDTYVEFSTLLWDISLDSFAEDLMKEIHLLARHTILKKLGEEYVITDPCYLLDGKDWYELCAKLNESEEAFHQAIKEALEEKTGKKAWVSPTYAGDWSNFIKGKTLHYQGEFCADAGLVCVCKKPDKVDVPKHCYAVIQTLGEVEVNFEKKGRCIVHIKDEVGNTWNSQ